MANKIMIGVEYNVCDELLEIHLTKSEANNLAYLLRDSIRKITGQELLTTEDFKKIHRASRMCFELLQSYEITSIDKADSKILYDLPLTVEIEYLNRILNETRYSLRDTGDVSIVMADNFAKSVAKIMTE